MDHDYVYHRCLGDPEITTMLCRHLNIPIPKVKSTGNSPEYLKARASFDHQNESLSIIKMNEASTTCTDKVGILNECQYHHMPVEFTSQVFEDAFLLAKTFEDKMAVFSYTHTVICNDGFSKKINQWLTDNGTFENWLTFYRDADEDCDGCRRELAFNRMLSILEKERKSLTPQYILPEGEFYEEHLISP